MKINKKLLGPLLAFIIVLGVGTVFAFSDIDKVSRFHKFNGFNGEYHKTGFMGQLTEEQMTTLMQTKMDLREQEASWEEMNEAMKLLFDEWGVDYPDWGDKSKSRFGRHMKGISFEKQGWEGQSYGEGCLYKGLVG